MSSTFLGLSIASRGLYSAQAALAVTSNNISNVSTEGYSRQTVAQSAVGPAATYSSAGYIGGGSEVTGVERVRDTGLDSKYWRENGYYGEWSAKADVASELESVLGDTSSNGFTTAMDDFYAALEDLSKASSEDSVRTTVRETGEVVCQYLNDAANRLTELRDTLNGEIKTAVEQVNSYTQQIADLNDRIRVGAAAGAATSALEDERANLIDKLSALAKVEVDTVQTGSASADEVLTIKVNGVSMVTGGKARQLECYENAAGQYGVRWQDTAEEFAPGNGAVQAYLDLRDGDGSGTAYQGIPYYQQQLDDFSRSFAKAFNEGIYKDGSSYYGGHVSGLGADGSSGIRFFAYDDLSSADFSASGSTIDAMYANLTAANITLSADVQDDLSTIAAASSSGGADNNENCNALLSICKDTRMFATGTPEDFMNSIIFTMGSASSYAQKLSDSKESIVSTLEARRTSVSGVSSNEETANLTKYEQAYSASANLVNVWSEIYKETINLL